VTAWRAVPCRSCEAWVIWAATAEGKRMPVDARPAAGGTVQLQTRPGSKTPAATVLDEAAAAGRVDLRKAHFATCPDADVWRRR